MIDQNSTFFAILTAIGEAKQANADALGIAWLITHMGVGDANDTDPLPDRLQTTLINERRRAPLNQLVSDPKNPGVLMAEQVIPADVGGWWVREIGLYDADGDLIAIANCAPSYKPLLPQGSGRTQVVRMTFIISSTANVVLKIDPSVVLATRAYVDRKVLEELDKLDFKHSVLVATTGSVMLAGLSPVDGMPLSAGASVLVKDQDDPTEHGIWITAKGAWSRRHDADSDLEVTPGLFVHVEQGNANGNSVWQLVTDAPIKLGTTALQFEVVVGRTGVAAGTYRSVTVNRSGRVIAATNPTTLKDYAIDLASVDEAQCGVENSKPMTALRVWQAIAKGVLDATESVLGLARFATQDEVNAGANDGVSVTPKKLKLGFSISLNSNGFILFPTWLGGLVIQWVNGVSNNTEYGAFNTWPLAFSNKVIIATVCHEGTSPDTYQVYNFVGCDPRVGLNVRSPAYDSSTISARVIGIGC